MKFGRTTQYLLNISAKNHQNQSLQF